MKNLTTAIYGKLAGSTLFGYVQGRLYKNRAPEGAPYPYLVYAVIVGDPEYTFSENYEDVTVQFDIFSKDASTTEIENIFTALTALFDNISFNPTAERVLEMQRQSYSLTSEEHYVTTAEIQVYHYTVDYNVYLERTS